MSLAETIARAEDKIKGAIEDSAFSKARNVFSGDAQFFSVLPSREQLRKALDDPALSSKKDGMKGVLAQMCLGMDMSALFPDVVKNIHAPSIELRKFIYTFIVHYCDERPNEALLSISAFQKDLLDRSIHVRSLALRVLSSIRISSIQPVVMLAIKKAMTDVAPLVRRTAAVALIKAHRISKGDSTDQSAEVIAKLLGDRNMDVAGAAAAAWLEVLPTRYDLIHRDYRRLCRGLSEAGDHAQISLLRMLLRYCRANFSDPNKQIQARQEARQEARKNNNAANAAAAKEAGGKDNNNNKNKKKDDSSSGSSSDSDSDDDKKKTKKSGGAAAAADDKGSKKNGGADDDEYESFFSGSKKKPASPVAKKAEDAASSSRASSPSSPTADMDLGYANDIDDDHRLLLNSAKPLLHSANRAVVLHAIALFYHCAPNDMLDPCAKPLLRVLNGPKECVLPALVAANSFISKRHQPLVPFVQDFFPLPKDTLNERDLKLRIMAKLATRDNLAMLTKELGSHFRVMEVRHTISAVQGLARIAFSVPNTSRDILRQLLPLLAHRNSDVVSEVVVALRQVVCLGHDASQTLRTIQQLARGILTNKITTPEARASVLWLVADNLKSHPTITKMAPDMFRTFLASFKADPIVVRRQLLFLGQKIFLHMEAENELTARFKLMLQYLLELLKFDEDYDLRDAGNMLAAAMDRSSEAFKLLKAADDHRTAHKPAPEIQDPFGDRSALELTSMSHLVGFSSLKYTELPLWADTCSAAAVRDPPQVASTNNPLLDDDSDSTTTSECGSEKAGSDSDSDSDKSDGAADAAKKPAAPVAVAVKPKIQVNIKTIVKPTAPQPGKGDRILKDFFTASAPAAKPGAKAVAVVAVPVVERHADPSPPGARPKDDDSETGSDGDK